MLHIEGGTGKTFSILILTKRFFNNILFRFRSQSNIQSAEIGITDEDQDETHNSNHGTAGDEHDTSGLDDIVEEQLYENKFKRKRETSRSLKSDKDKPEVLSVVSPSTKRNRPNDTLLQLLKNKEQERQHLGKYVDQLMGSSEESEIDLLFKSLAATVKKFQPEDVIEAKMKIFNVVTEIELRNQRARRSRMSTFNESCTRPSSALSSHSSSNTYVEQSSDYSNMSKASLPPNFNENAPYANPSSPFQLENAHPPSMMSAQFNTDLSEAPFVNPASPLQVQYTHSSSKVLPSSNISFGNISSEDPSSPFQVKNTSNPNFPETSGHDIYTFK